MAKKLENIKLVLSINGTLCSCYKRMGVRRISVDRHGKLFTVTLVTYRTRCKTICTVSPNYVYAEKCVQKFESGSEISWIDTHQNATTVTYSQEDEMVTRGNERRLFILCIFVFFLNHKCISFLSLTSTYIYISQRII